MARRRKFAPEFKQRVLQYAEGNSAEETARHFHVDIRRILSWRKQKEDRTRAPVPEEAGSEELEERLSDWIYCQQHSQLTRNMIRQKALDIYPSVSDGGKTFSASTVWLQSFLQRNDLSLRRQTATPQVDQSVATEKLVGFIASVGRTVSSKGISEHDIIAMDEMAVCFDDMVAGDNSEGHKRRHLTVALAATADGAKLKPFVVFRGADGEAAEVQQQVSGAVIASSVNGWMSDALTAHWLQSVVGKSSTTPRLLVWDSYRCHVAAATRAELESGYNITTAAIPAGCTKYLQAPEVTWSEPFQRNLREAYDGWRTGKEATPGGDLELPERRLLVDWVVSAWDRLDPDLIAKSFKACGLSVKSDGSEDQLIVCFREGQPCSAGQEVLTRVRQENQDNQERQENQGHQEEEDEEELFKNELVVLDDEEQQEVAVKAAVKPAVSIVHTRGEVGGGVAAHLQCPFCGHFSKSHAHQLTHVAASHPSSLDDVAVGRLGNILIYQSTARLFHCADCFFTCRDFAKLYKHIISKHCEDEREGGDEEGGKDKGRSDAEEEEEADEEVASQKEESGKADGDDSILMFDGAGYHCLICGWRTKLKSLVVGHVVRKHDIPKRYATQAIRRDIAAASSTEEEETTSGLSGELLKEEMEATAKVVRFISNRFVCLICGWKTKLKGFAISHVVRSHDVERPYTCKACPRSFFLPSRLQQHVRTAHRPGRFACPFCCFRSHFLGGFRRHCSRCNAREEEDEEEEEGGGAWLEQEENEEQEERKERRGERKRRRTEKLMEEEDWEAAC